MLAGCLPLPLRYDSSGNPLEISRETLSHKFRYFSIDAIASARFHNGPSGLNSGAGISISVPPFLPVGTAITALGTVGGGVVGVFSGEYIDIPAGDDNPLAAAAAVINTGLVVGNFGVGAAQGLEATGKTVLKPEMLTHGVRNKNSYISDISVDLSYSFTRHEDTLGDFLNYHSILLGAKLASPAWLVPKYYARGGVGMHYFWFSDRPDFSTPGLFAALGFEFQASGTETLGIEYMTHYYVGQDTADIPSGSGLNQWSFCLTKYF